MTLSMVTETEVPAVTVSSDTGDRFSNAATGPTAVTLTLACFLEAVKAAVVMTLPPRGIVRFTDVGDQVIAGALGGGAAAAVETAAPPSVIASTAPSSPRRARRYRDGTIVLTIRRPPATQPREMENHLQSRTVPCQEYA